MHYFEELSVAEIELVMDGETVIKDGFQYFRVEGEDPETLEPAYGIGRMPAPQRKE